VPTRADALGTKDLVTYTGRVYQALGLSGLGHMDSVLLRNHG